MVAASNQLMIVSLAHKWWFLKVGDGLQFDVGVPWVSILSHGRP